MVVGNHEAVVYEKRVCHKIEKHGKTETSRRGTNVCWLLSWPQKTSHWAEGESCFHRVLCTHLVLKGREKNAVICTVAIVFSVSLSHN